MFKEAEHFVIQATPKDENSTFAGQTFPMKRLHFKMQSHVAIGLLPGSVRMATGASVTVSAGDYPLQRGKNDRRKTKNGSLSVASDLYFGEPTEREELAAIRESSMRSKLMGKLSDANNYSRHLQRQIREKEAALFKCKSELTRMELELQAIVGLLAQEAAAGGAKAVSRKIDGRYVHSHVALKLQELQKQFVSQVEEIDTVCFRTVPIVWYGMAEAVQVMGSFDGWSQGEAMSPETSGSLTKFSALLKLRPGRYEIKLLVDGEWQTSPDLPTVGESNACNNLLVVK